jgi:hypothetical protein
MKIYFACSITSGREFEPVYQAIVRALKEDGREVPTAHPAESGVTAREAALDPYKVYARDVEWIRACDTLIAEVSTPSLGWDMRSVLRWEMENPCWLCISAS